MGLFDRFQRHKDAELEAQRLLEQGMEHEQQGKLDEALQCYEEAIALMPQLARAHFNRANILLDRGEAQMALDGYTKAIEYKPDSAAAHYNMGNAYATLERPENALAEYQLAIALKSEFTDAHVAIAAVYEELGKHEASIASYQRALEIQPDHIDANNALGTKFFFHGRFIEAAERFRHCLRVNPKDSSLKMRLGDTLHALGNLEDAAECFQSVAKTDPNNAEAHSRLGLVLCKLGKIDDAIVCARRALESNPDHPFFHFNLANTLYGNGSLTLAKECYCRAIELKPDLAEAHNNLGAIEKRLLQSNAAVICFQKAIAIRPDYLDAHYNLGVVLQTLGQRADAAEAFCRAIKISPDYAPAHSSYGAVLQELGDLMQAEKSCRRALQLKPDFAHAHNNLGTTLAMSGRYDEAISSYKHALKIDANYSSAHMNLGSALKDIGHFEEALKSVRRALVLDPTCAKTYHTLLSISHFLNAQEPDAMLADARYFGDLVARKANPFAAWLNSSDTTRCLRIGFVSGDFRNHPVGYFLDSVLAALSANSTKLALYAYPTHVCDDKISARLKSHCSGWHPAVSLSDEQLANRIREDRIDILIDLAGHTANNRLAMFAWKPAPVQVSWLGYFATTGVAAIDYFIADPWTLPVSEEQHFTEQIWRLPETRLCFTSPDVDVAVSELPALSKHYITFGCFNNLSKMNDAVVALWARIMNAVPNSHLFLKAGQISMESVRQSIYGRFAAHGIKPERLILEDFAPRAQYFGAYQQVDIALDPFPYTGGTTTVESLWMGVPVLTLAGERFLSRQGVGLLMNAGLPEWVATDPDDYVARALSHARDLSALSALRAGLRQQVLTSPIFDAPRFAKHLEAALRGMWEKWCVQQSGSQARIEETDDGTI